MSEAPGGVSWMWCVEGLSESSGTPVWRIQGCPAGSTGGLNCLFQIIHGLFEIVPDTVLSFQDGEMVFNEEVFLEHKSSSMRQFLQSAVHLQFFKQVNYMSPASYCHLSDREDTTTLRSVL